MLALTPLRFPPGLTTLRFPLMQTVDAYPVLSAPGQIRYRRRLLSGGDIRRRQRAVSLALDFDLCNRGRNHPSVSFFGYFPALINVTSSGGALTERRSKPIGQRAS